MDGSGLGREDLDGLAVSSFTLAPDHPVALTQHFGLSPRWFESIPLGGAAGIIALRRAARAVQAGDAHVVACIAGGTNNAEAFRDIVSRFTRFSQDAVYPYGSGGPNASFALITDHYMRLYGATREDFGKMCVAQRTNALAFPHALMKRPLSLDDWHDRAVQGRGLSPRPTLLVWRECGHFAGSGGGRYLPHQFAIFPINALRSFYQARVYGAIILADDTVKHEDLIRFCEGKMSYFSVPRFVEFVGDLPRTDNGKVQKFKLRERGITPDTWDREGAGIVGDHTGRQTVGAVIGEPKRMGGISRADQ